MHFLTSFYWESDTGSAKQDSIAIQSVLTKRGPMVMACVCDGSLGLTQGEIASGYLVERITDWFYHTLMSECQNGVNSTQIRKSGYRLLYSIDLDLKNYAKKKKIQVGSTVTMLLLLQRRYFIFKIGDSGVYRLRVRMKQMSRNLMYNESALNKSVGAGIWIKPECLQGLYRKNDAFLLCTDGFRHYTSENVLQTLFCDTQIKGEKEAYRRMREVGMRNRERGEKNAISAIYIKVL